MDLRKELFKSRDLKYKNFHKKLVPNIDENKIIGVRVPTVRKSQKPLLQRAPKAAANIMRRLKHLVLCFQ